MNSIARTIKQAFIGVSLLALTSGVAGGFGGAYLFHRAEPIYDGHTRISGLSGVAEVYRDAYGVPHIFAANRDDAARALGYVHASERMFQMEMQRRAGQGRLSEIVGSDMLGIDKFTRTLGLYRLAQSSFVAMSPEAQRTFQAYADGVNTWLETHRNTLSPEFVLLHAVPEPWQPADSVVWGKLMALQLSHNYNLEMLRADMAAKLPPEQTQWLFPAQLGTPVTTQPGGGARAVSDTPLHPAQRDWVVSPPPSQQSEQSQLPQLPMSADAKLAELLGMDHAASNEWVIGGARTVSGKPILANDPHLGLEAPILWYLARIVTPDGNVKGATVPGLPVVLLGQNDHLAWGFTTTGSDTQDLFVETVDPANPNNYVTPDGSVAFVETTETIHVKDAADVKLVVRNTRHGPVLSDIDAHMANLAGAGKVMALAFTGLGGLDTTSEALLRINGAHSAAELLDALKLYQTPTQNIVYADSDGIFGFVNPGLVPVRKKGDGSMPVDGASGDYDWVGTLPLELLPQVANPAAGYVFNANNAVVGPDSPYDLGKDWEEPYRARRLQQFFNATGKFTMAQSVAMQADHLSLAATDMLPLLLSISPSNPRTKQALDMLRVWDAVMDKAKAEPAIFEAWLYQLHKHMLLEKTGIDMRDKGPLAASTLFELVTQHPKEWCGAADADCHTMMEKSLDDALAMETEHQGDDMGRWHWGMENMASLRHKFYSHIPVLDKLSDLSVASSGDFYTIDRGGGFNNDTAHPLARTHGGGYRGVYDLGNPDASLFMIATGESGHIFSKHYGDLVPLWNDVKAITLSGSARELKQSGASELVLEP
jgi:penicillin amidase